MHKRLRLVVLRSVTMLGIVALFGCGERSSPSEAKTTDLSGETTEAAFQDAFREGGSSSDPNTEFETNLGQNGNTDVAQRFAAYKSHRQQNSLGCTSSSSAKRVMVTGFGLFDGVTYNLSGVIAQSLGSAAFTPQSPLSGPDQIGLAGTVGAGSISSSAKGATTAVRTLRIRGIDYEVCTVVLDVIWDLAAAIIVHEAESFQPDMIFMSGIGGNDAVFEAGANNQALAYSGFASAGSSLPINTPVGGPVLPGSPVEVPMTWDAVALESATSSLIADIGYASVARTDATVGNTYICNNVSFVTLEAVRGIELRLANGEIRWTPSVTSAPKVGFFHYPSTGSNRRTDVAKWIRVVTTAIDTQLN